MLRSIMVYLGVASEKAEVALAKDETRHQRSQLIKTGERSELWINEGFARAWRLTGVALDRVGVCLWRIGIALPVSISSVTASYREQARKRRASFPDSHSGGMMKTVSTKESQYQVKLLELDQGTQVLIKNQDGSEGGDQCGWTNPHYDTRADSLTRVATFCSPRQW